MPERRDRFSETILVLGGTAEANALISGLITADRHRRLILSLAGRTATPKVPSHIEVRVGGFGGIEGLTNFIAREGVTLLVDATHPFAARISANAERAAVSAVVPRIALVRPAWTEEAGDIWTIVDTIEAAAKALPARSRPFLALGRQYLDAFAGRDDLTPVVRMIDPPTAPLPLDAEIVLGRPSHVSAREAELFEEHAVTHLVCRNSGGTASYAKIAAARNLGLPVIVIERPPPPGAPLAETVDDVIRWLAGSHDTSD